MGHFKGGPQSALLNVTFKSMDTIGGAGREVVQDAARGVLNGNVNATVNGRKGSILRLFLREII